MVEALVAQGGESPIQDARFGGRIEAYRDIIRITLEEIS